MFFWYRLTRVFPDKFHRAVKRLCVCVCVKVQFFLFVARRTIPLHLLACGVIGMILGFTGVLCSKVQEQKGNYDAYVIRHLKATCHGETRELTHIHYTEFPDRGIPKCVPSLLDMIELMRELQSANLPEALPVVIHCRQV